MRIAMIGQKGIPAMLGGVERHVEELSAHLVMRGHDVTVFCRPHYAEPTPPKRLGLRRLEAPGTHRGVRLRLLPSIPTKHLDAITHVSLATLAAVFGEFDIFHYHSIGPALMSFFPAFWRRRLVATVHALDWQRQKWGPRARKALKLGERFALRFPHETIVVSPHLQDYFQEYYGIETTFISNGVEKPDPRPLKHLKSFELLAGEYVLYLGRLVPEKGCHYLIDAFRGLDTDKKLLIAGDTRHSADYAKSLQHRAEGDSRIIFAGPLFGEEKAEAFSNACAFVLPSEIEGMPISLLEAMSYGCACLVSDIPENRAVVSEGEERRGFTFAARDVADLRRGLTELIGNPDSAHPAADRGRGYVLAEYAWPRIAEETEQVYRRVRGECEPQEQPAACPVSEDDE